MTLCKCLLILNGESDDEWSETRADLAWSKAKMECRVILYLTSLVPVVKNTNNLILVSAQHCKRGSNSLCCWNFIHFFEELIGQKMLLLSHNLTDPPPPK